MKSQTDRFKIIHRNGNVTIFDKKNMISIVEFNDKYSKNNNFLSEQLLAIIDEFYSKPNIKREVEKYKYYTKEAEDSFTDVENTMKDILEDTLEEVDFEIYHDRNYKFDLEFNIKEEDNIDGFIQKLEPFFGNPSDITNESVVYRGI